MEVDGERLHQGDLGGLGADDAGHGFLEALVEVEPWGDGVVGDVFEVAVDAFGAPAVKLGLYVVVGGFGLETEGVAA